MIFWRIFNNELYSVDEVNKLGFEKAEGLMIPDDYLKKQNFLVMRTAHGIGDWGILSAMPRLIKEKYPNSKVYVPSKKLLQKLFNLQHDNANYVFYNNPYVNDFVDSIDGEVFHDHYRIYDEENTDVPLIKQMLKFWQFSENEYKDYLPEIYWTNEEKEFGNKIIKKYVGDEDFGCLLMSDRFGTQRGKHVSESYDKDVKVMSDVLQKNNLPYFYWTNKPINKTPFNFINTALDLRNVNIRVQLFIKAKAKLNVSNQCGMSHLVARYSKCFESQRQYPIEHNYISKINYL